VTKVKDLEALYLLGYTRSTTRRHCADFISSGRWQGRWGYDTLCRGFELACLIRVGGLLLDGALLHENKNKVEGKGLKTGYMKYCDVLLQKPIRQLEESPILDRAQPANCNKLT
jgi:hypothetical protein